MHQSEMGKKNILAATRWTRLMFWSLFRSDCGRAKEIHENFLSFFRQAATLDTNFLWKSLQAMMQRWSFFADGLSFFGEDEIYESLDEVLVRIRRSQDCRTSIDSLWDYKVSFVGDFFCKLSLGKNELKYWKELWNFLFKILVFQLKNSVKTKVFYKYSRKRILNIFFILKHQMTGIVFDLTNFKFLKTFSF